MVSGFTLLLIPIGGKYVGAQMAGALYGLMHLATTRGAVVLQIGWTWAGRERVIPHGELVGDTEGAVDELALTTLEG
jgi:hypothetical protein